MGPELHKTNWKTFLQALWQLLGKMTILHCILFGLNSCQRLIQTIMGEQLDPLCHFFTRAHAQWANSFILLTSVPRPLKMTSILAELSLISIIAAFWLEEARQKTENAGEHRKDCAPKKRWASELNRLQHICLCCADSQWIHCIGGSPQLSTLLWAVSWAVSPSCELSWYWAQEHSSLAF